MVSSTFKKSKGRQPSNEKSINKIHRINSGVFIKNSSLIDPKLG